MIGLGNSALDYMQQMVGAEMNLEFDEVWTCNMGMRVFQHDLLWVMDDLRVQSKKFPAYGRALAQHNKPIMTSEAYPEFPMSQRYPIEEVTDALGDDYLVNTVCFATAYAMVTGVEDLWLFGCDFWYPNISVREEGGMCAAYLLGRAQQFGMNFHIPQGSTLLNAHNAGLRSDGKLHRTLYGYAKQPLFSTGGQNSATSTGSNSQVRENQGNNVGQAQGNPTRITFEERKEQPAHLHSEGRDLLRRRRGPGNGKPTGVVLDGTGENQPGSASGVRGDILKADGSIGSISNFTRSETCDCCGVEHPRNPDEAA